MAYYFCAECGRTSKKITDFREIVSQHVTKRLCIGCPEKRKRTHHLTVLCVPLLEVGHELLDGHPSLLDDVPHSPSHNLIPPLEVLLPHSQFLERWDESTWCTLMHTSDRLPMRIASKSGKTKQPGRGSVVCRVRWLAGISLMVAMSSVSYYDAPDALATRPSSVAAPVFTPILHDLHGAHIPVYLPAWMPRYHGRIYPTGGLDKHGHAFFVNLSTQPRAADASLAFWLIADMSAGDTTGRRISLGHGIIGILNQHTGGNEGPTLSWHRGPVWYQIGAMADDHQLIRAARSMVRVSV